MELDWDISEIKHTHPKEDVGIPNFLHTFFIGKNNYIFGPQGKEDMGIQKKNMAEPIHAFLYRSDLWFWVLNITDLWFRSDMLHQVS